MSAETAHYPRTQAADAAHHRRLLWRKWARNIHIYTSMLALVAVIFFATTGLLLNHPDWFNSSDPHTRTATGKLPFGMLKEPDKVAVVEALRKDHGATGALESFDVQEGQLDLVFRSPGRRFDATIERSTGHLEATIETHGFVGRITELHRGVDAGPAWRLIIDATAILLLIISCTGLSLWLLVPKWRPLGLAAIAVCLVICTAVYFVLVP